MIISEKPSSGSLSFLEAPPSYERFNQSSSTLNRRYLKSPGTRSCPSLPLAQRQSSPAVSSVLQKRPIIKTRSGWLDKHHVVRTAKDVKSTVYKLVRDIVEQTPSSTISTSFALLENCAAACTAHDFSFSSILQEPYIESHPPIYWAIIKRPLPDKLELVTSLLSYAAPLTQQTISQIRLACVQLGDHELFRTLWAAPELARVSGTDQVILAGSVVHDTIEVDELPHPAFLVHFGIAKFETRMKVTGQIVLEFIARGRMWCLCFHVIPRSSRKYPGAWAVSLSLIEHSPPTWIDSHLVIQESTTHPSLPSTSSASSNIPRSNNDSAIFSTLDSAYWSMSEDSTLSFHLKPRGSRQLVAPSPNGRKKPMRLTYVMNKNGMGSNLQFPTKNLYYDSEGTLRATLEAQLSKPDRGCIIC